jgi:hypothetical protein
MDFGVKVAPDHIQMTLNRTFFDSLDVQASSYNPASFNVFSPNGKMA